MKIAIANICRSITGRNYEYHLYTTKTFVETRSGGKIDVDIVDVFMTDDVQTSAKVLLSSGYSIVLFRIFHWSTKYASKVCGELSDKDLLMGVWGYDSAAHPENYFSKSINFIIQDEPELSLYEVASYIIEKRDPSRAAGIIFRNKKEKEAIYGASRQLPKLDLIPSPYLNGMIPVDSETVVHWEVARGCLYRCDFCSDFSHLNNVRYHSPSYMEKELEFFCDRGVREIIIGAPVANINNQYFKVILELMERLAPDVHFDIQLRPDILSRDEIDVLSRLNVYISFGIQTFEKKILSDLRTSLNIEKARNNIRYMNNYPTLAFGIDIIGGLPKIDYDSFLGDIDAAMRLWPVNLNIFRLSLFPGTVLANRQREFGYSVRKDFPYYVRENEDLSVRDAEKIDEMAESVDFMYNRGRMVTIFTTLSDALKQKPHEVLERWLRWTRKNEVDFSREDFDYVFKVTEDFFSYMFSRFQQKKLWPIARDILVHNYCYTSSMSTVDEDIITYPYTIEQMDESSNVGLNASVFTESFSYNIEELTETTIYNLERSYEDMEKEESEAVVYRFEGDVFTEVVSEVEADIFRFIDKKGITTLGEIKKRYSDYDVEEIVSLWCDDGVLFVKND
ncbi:MAG: radical SAM protein [bacterium]